MLGSVLFVGGVVGYITGQLPAEYISGIGALTPIFVGVGAGMTKAKRQAGGGRYSIEIKICKSRVFEKKNLSTLSDLKFLSLCLFHHFPDEL